MPNVDPHGPMFISYAWHDGKSIARACALALRGSGVPVWFDETDMGAGRFDQSIREAADRGISGAVLIATPAVADSQTIQVVEGPLWQEMLTDSQFIMAVVNSDGQDGKADYGLPDEVLPGPGTKLRFYKQYPVVENDWLERLVRDIISARLRHLESRAPTDSLVISVTSRTEPRAIRSDGHLSASLEPPVSGSTTLSPTSVEQLGQLLRVLPEIAQETGRSRVIVSGGMHLGVAFCVGAALTAPTGIELVYDDQYGNRWTSAEEDGVAIPLSVTQNLAQGPIAVFVDLVPNKPIDAAFERDFDAVEGASRPWMILTAEDRSDIAPSNGEATARAIAQRIVAFASASGTREVHLCLRTPAALAALTARHTNTLRITLYEWERNHSPPRYEAMAAVVPGDPAGPIMEE